MFENLFKDLNKGYKEEARGLFEETYNALTREQKIDYCHKHPTSRYAKDKKYNPELQEQEEQAQKKSSLSLKLKDLMDSSKSNSLNKTEDACHKLIRNYLLDIYENTPDYNFNNIKFKSTSCNGRLRPFVFALGLPKVCEIGEEELQEFKNNINIVEDKLPNNENDIEVEEPEDVVTLQDIPADELKEVIDNQQKVDDFVDKMFESIKEPQVEDKLNEEQQEVIEKLNAIPNSTLNLMKNETDLELKKSESLNMVLENLKSLPQDQQEAYLGAYKWRIEKLAKELAEGRIKPESVRERIAELGEIYEEAMTYGDYLEPVKNQFTEEDFTEFTNKLRDIRLNEDELISEAFLRKYASRILMIEDMIDNHQLKDKFAFQKFRNPDYYTWMQHESKNIEMVNEKYAEERTKRKVVRAKKPLPVEIQKSADMGIKTDTFHCPICDKEVHFDMDIYNRDDDDEDSKVKKTQPECRWLGIDKYGNEVRRWVCIPCYDEFKKPRNQLETGEDFTKYWDVFPIRDKYSKDITDTFNYGKGDNKAIYGNIKSYVRQFSDKVGRVIPFKMYGDGSVDLFNNIDTTNLSINSFLDKGDKTAGHEDWRGHFRIKMHKVAGDFIMDETNFKGGAHLNSLDGCPKEVEGDFVLKNLANLKTLKSTTNKENPDVRLLPEYVGKSVVIQNTALESFDGLPEDLASKMNPDDFFTNHQLKDTKGIPNGLKTNITIPNAINKLEMTEVDGNVKWNPICGPNKNSIEFNDKLKCKKLCIGEKAFSVFHVSNLNEIECEDSLEVKGNITFDKMPKKIKTPNLVFSGGYGNENKYYGSTCYSNLLQNLDKIELDGVKNIDLLDGTDLTLEEYNTLNSLGVTINGKPCDSEELKNRVSFDDSKINEAIKFYGTYKGTDIDNIDDLTDESIDIINKSDCDYIPSIRNVNSTNADKLKKITKPIKELSVYNSPESFKLEITNPEKQTHVYTDDNSISEIGDNQNIKIENTHYKGYEDGDTIFSLKKIGNNSKVSSNSTDELNSLEYIGNNCSIENGYTSKGLPNIKHIGDDTYIKRLKITDDSTVDLPLYGNIYSLELETNNEKYSVLPAELKVDDLELYRCGFKNRIKRTPVNLDVFEKKLKDRCKDAELIKKEDGSLELKTPLDNTDEVLDLTDIYVPENLTVNANVQFSRDYKTEFGVPENFTCNKDLILSYVSGDKPYHLPETTSIKNKLILKPESDGYSHINLRLSYGLKEYPKEVRVKDYPRTYSFIYQGDNAKHIPIIYEGEKKVEYMGKKYSLEDYLNGVHLKPVEKKPVEKPVEKKPTEKKESKTTQHFNNSKIDETIVKKPLKKDSGITKSGKCYIYNCTLVFPNGTEKKVPFYGYKEQIDNNGSYPVAKNADEDFNINIWKNAYGDNFKVKQDSFEKGIFGKYEAD